MIRNIKPCFVLNVGRPLVGLLFLSCHPYGAKNVDVGFATIMTSLRDYNTFTPSGFIFKHLICYNNFIPSGLKK